MFQIMSVFFTITPLHFFVQSIWRDEAFSFLMAKKPLIDLLITTAKDANPPLYYLVLKLWMIFFGNSEIAMRSLSLVFFVATLYVIYLILNTSFKIPPRLSIIYLLLFACNPLLQYYAFEARMYSMLAFFATLTLYAFLQRDKKMFVWSSILGIYTHYFMSIALIPFTTMFLLYRKERKTVQFILKTYPLIIVSAIPWIIVVFFAHSPPHTGFWIMKPDLSTFFHMPSIIFTGYEPYLNYQYPLLTHISLLLYGLIGYAVYKHKNRCNSVFLLLCAGSIVLPFGMLIFSLFFPIFLSRYLIFTTVYELLFLVMILQQYKKKLKYIFLVILFLISFHYGETQVFIRRKSDLKTPLTVIKSLMKQGDVVYVTHEYNFHPAQYYIGESNVYIYGKTYDELPWYIGKVLIPKNRIATTLPIYPHRAFILHDDLSYTIQAIY